MEIVQPKKYERKTHQEEKTIPTAKGGVETNYAFHWPLFKAQAHAIAPFEYNQPSRADNTQRNDENRR